MNRQVVEDLEMQLTRAAAKIELTRTFMIAATDRLEKLNQSNEYSETAIVDGEKCVDAFEDAKANHRKIRELLDQARLKWALPVS